MAPESLDGILPGPLPNGLPGTDGGQKRVIFVHLPLDGCLREEYNWGSGKCPQGFVR